ncbi:MAG: glycosyltransferase family 2 protein [Lachnospiraceae bacterium]|nr:glycosyltransferase family 2 protein [Lachnospiraceae bacterium]
MLSDFDLEGKNKLQKAVYYLRYYGMSYTAKKALRKIGVPISEESEYMTWCRRMAATKAELKQQKESEKAKKIPFTIVLEAEESAEAAGWKKQTCSNVSVVNILKGMSLAELLKEVNGEYVVFSGKDIKAAPEYLYEITKCITEPQPKGESKVRIYPQETPDVIYTDEDNCVGKKRIRPFFKPDMSKNMLLNFQYMGRCFVVKRSLLEIIAENKELELSGNDWYDIALQAFYYAKHVRHIPKVLFSNKVTEETKTEFVRAKDGKGEECIRRYLKTAQMKGKVIKSDVAGFYHVEMELDKEPLVSIIIPNKDHIEDLKLCLDSLREKSDYTNYEVIIAENNSEKEETFAYYEKLQKEDAKIRVVTWKGIFNYSAINNFAVKEAKGEILLFLNNDTEFMDAKTLRELVTSTMKSGVGAAGAMLYYGDETIQHGGIIMGMGGFAAHALWSLTDRDEKYYPFSLCEREVSGCTGACLMVRRNVFEEIGQMDKDFVVALNDVDLCMKIRAAGYEIIFNPYARLYHYESKSRGYEDTMEKQARFQREIANFQSKWENEITEKDPYYNPNLTLHRADYSMDI